MSMMRKIEPFFGGAIPILVAARSAVPEMSAGVWSVTQTRREVTLRFGRTTLCGLAPSNSTTALPSLSTVVTTRRMSSLRGIPCFSLSDRLGVDQHERDRARLIGAVGPGVVGATLDQHVTGLEQDLAFIHHRVDFSRQHDRIVDRAGLVKSEMPLIAAIGCRHPARAVIGFGELGGERLEPLLVGRIFDDAEDAAHFRRREAEVAPDRILVAPIVCRRCGSLPQFGDDRAA